jgi:hypothetical protein
MIDFYGDQTRWFMGEVVDINDPKQLARIKVRIYGIHDDTDLIKDDDLPWAQVVTPITEGGTNGLGNPLGIQVNALVFGIFLDGGDSQLPLIFGSLPKYEGDKRDIPSTNKLARGENTLTKSVSVSGAPGDPYAAVYPNNKVTQTSSGHIIEIDDTDGAERIHIRHKSGAFVEFHPDGSVVIKTTNVYIDAGTNANVKATNVNVDGSTVNITGGTGDVIVSGISLVNHTHTDTTGLSAGTTSKPN